MSHLYLARYSCTGAGIKKDCIALLEDCMEYFFFLIRETEDSLFEPESEDESFVPRSLLVHRCWTGSLRETVLYYEERANILTRDTADKKVT